MPKLKTGTPELQTLCSLNLLKFSPLSKLLNKRLSPPQTKNRSHYNWSIGTYIRDRLAKSEWGQKAIEQLIDKEAQCPIVVASLRQKTKHSVKF
ncbi:hypothetical protein V2H45_15325 [Tumidithrix elongata RA019]|uniref:Uncharacterized protein n=1 Tax=Tumidithrix elongata BACA0141 TaxID=2716417 RepID=A0AAW9Q4D3_9CYAN|nr:hypothetical protein [Tumidithrix elongata RA019]